MKRYKGVLWLISMTPLAEAGDTYPADKSRAHLLRHVAKISSAHHFSHKKEAKLIPLWIHYSRYPIVLKKGCRDSLEELQLFSQQQLNEFQRYITEYGAPISLYELQGIPTWDTTSLRLATPFLKVLPLRSGAAVAPIQEFSIYVKDKKSTDKRKKEELGPSYHCLLRYRITKKNHYQCCLIASKASGEPLWYGHALPMRGPLGYWAGYAVYESPKGLLRKLIVGDYEVGVGQGVMLGAHFGMGKSQEVIKVMKTQNQGIKPMASFSRKASFRGVACSLAQDGYEWLIYASLRGLDATIKKDSYIESLTGRGVSYRTLACFDKRNVVKERVIGTSIIYRSKQNTVTLGMQALYHDYSVPLNLGRGLGHTHFFHGNKNSNIGIFGSGIWRSCHFFGEAVRAQSGGKALLVGVMACPAKKVDISLVGYHYAPHFHSFYSNSFGKNGIYNRNKQGIYMGGVYRMHETLTWKGYVDIFRYLVAQKNCHQPLRPQQEVRLCSVYQPIRGRTLNLQLKAKQYYVNQKGGSRAQALMTLARRGTCTCKATYPLSTRYQADTQLQLTALQKGASPLTFGGGCKQVIHLRKERYRLTMWLSLYHTDGYAGAVRFYSHNLRGLLSFPALYGNYGIESGLLLRYRISPSLRLGVRASGQWRILTGKGNREDTNRSDYSFSLSINLSYKAPLYELTASKKPSTAPMRTQ